MKLKRAKHSDIKCLNFKKSFHLCIPNEAEYKSSFQGYQDSFSNMPEVTPKS